MSLTIIKNNKGKNSLVVDGYTYYLEKKQKNVYRWSCAQKKHLLCKGRVSTLLDTENHILNSSPTSHCHEPTASAINIANTNAKLKIDARNSESRPSQIIRSSIVDCAEDCRVYLPSNNAQKMKIKRVRTNRLKEPENLCDIDIPESLKFIEGELFVLADTSFGVNEKLIILGSKSNLQFLSQAKCWLMDGTFHVVPSIFRQLFTIQGKIDSETVPLIYCLMSSKSKLAYDEFFFNLHRIACEFSINLNPDRIISDFEIASVSSAKQFFPDAHYQGCLFHFGKIIWRRIQLERLATKYGNNENFSK